MGRSLDNYCSDAGFQVGEETDSLPILRTRMRMLFVSHQSAVGDVWRYNPNNMPDSEVEG